MIYVRETECAIRCRRDEAFFSLSRSLLSPLSVGHSRSMHIVMLSRCQYNDREWKTIMHTVFFFFFLSFPSAVGIICQSYVCSIRFNCGTERIAVYLFTRLYQTVQYSVFVLVHIAIVCLELHCYLLARVFFFFLRSILPVFEMRILSLEALCVLWRMCDCVRWVRFGIAVARSIVISCNVFEK